MITQKSQKKYTLRLRRRVAAVVNDKWDIQVSSLTSQASIFNGIGGSMEFDKISLYAANNACLQRF